MHILVVTLSIRLGFAINKHNSGAKMSVFTVPVDKIKQEKNDEEDIEELLPVHKVLSESKLLQASVEVIDITENEYENEFKGFLNTLSDRRHDIDARRTGTKAKSKRVKHVLCVPAHFMSHVRIHQDTFVCELFRINFTNAMLYGTLTSKHFKDDVTIYQLDDGTAIVYVYHRLSNNKMLDHLNKLTCCEETLRRKPSPLNEESIPASVELRRHLRLLISMAKCQCHKQLARLELRTRCFVIGRPFTSIEGKVSVFAQTILPDDEIANSCELFWKTYLLAVYEPMLENVSDQNNSS
ncbi:uncharacterized protein LOC128712994 [Anopheles marshallii]|uniref:uncharacterized protein LOC128712994 n=1 Tax=Anopheles marshallii TaxID=1521116 RepID=UPI00237AB998|nr:uncharacterized protein LOC128712994 [Anopheles marshallii]